MFAETGSWGLWLNGEFNPPISSESGTLEDEVWPGNVYHWGFVPGDYILPHPLPVTVPFRFLAP